MLLKPQGRGHIDDSFDQLGFGNGSGGMARSNSGRMSGRHFPMAVPDTLKPGES
ncbi:hypothetical protein [Nodosilinea sp. FACHB-13]|uniref:hypothetical protein n=1 Tax=Cyanophyceae TaxID=3028117 RepID=UPI001F54D989|nr:hypothetical protein [Nodosilinea sp. FACHB-13]